MSHERFLPMHAVIELTGLSRATIYRRVDQGEFPKPVKVSERRICFKETQIREWMDTRQAA